MNTGPREWDAKTYDQISEPQYQWGLEVLNRLDPQPNESIIDAGCGSGRVTEKLLDRLANGRVVGVDGSAEMIKVAGEKFAGDDRVTLIISDLLDLTPELLEQNGSPAAVDALFSTATFHWITDHDKLFSRIHSVLRPGEGWWRSAGERETLRSMPARSPPSQRGRSTSSTSRGWP